MNSADRRAVQMGGSLAGMGMLHFAKPDFFDPLVPKWMPGTARFWTYASGVAELGSGVLTIVPKTRRFGAWCSLLTYIGLFPANIPAPLDGGMKDAPPPMNSAAAAWLRLPLQFPMFAQALRVRREAVP